MDDKSLPYFWSPLAPPYHSGSCCSSEFNGVNKGEHSLSHHYVPLMSQQTNCEAGNGKGQRFQKAVKGQGREGREEQDAKTDLDYRRETAL